MPYFITDTEPSCSNWAMVKDDGEVMGCHETKQGAIDQMIAVSLAEGIEPGGERALPTNYRPALDDSVPAGRACGNCFFYDESNTSGDRAWCERWNEYVRGDYYCNAWRSNDERQHNMNVEFRSFDADIVEVRAAESGNGMTFGGYAARYNSPSLPLPFTEVISPGAFDRTLKSKNDIRAYINHDERLILGSTRAKTLRLDNRGDGLYSEIDLPDTTYARDLSVSIQRGDVRTMSFGFSTVKDKWQDANNRTLVEVRLHEVSVVSGVAAYPATTASVRNLTLIAKRTDTDVSALTDAIAALESGEPLTDDQANVLRVVVDRSAPQQLVQELPKPDVTPLTVLMKQLDLIAKTF